MPHRWLNIWFLFVVVLGVGIVLLFKAQLSRNMPPTREASAYAMPAEPEHPIEPKAVARPETVAQPQPKIVSKPAVKPKAVAKTKAVAKPKTQPVQKPRVKGVKKPAVHPVALSVAHLPGRVEQLQQALDGESIAKAQAAKILRQAEQDIINLQDRKWLKANLSAERYAKVIDLRDYARTLLVQAGSKWRITLTSIDSL